MRESRGNWRKPLCPARVAVLDGGLPAWKAEGYPLKTAEVSEDEVDAAAAAARQPGASGRYPAKLQVDPLSLAPCLTHTRVHDSLQCRLGSATHLLARMLQESISSACLYWRRGAWCAA